MNISTTFGNMLMPSAQRWADDRSCRRILPISHLQTPINVGVFHVPWISWSETMSEYLGYKVLYNAHTFVYMEIYDFLYFTFYIFN